MATIASIFTLKLDNKDFNAQLQTAAKSSQDYNNKIANSLLEAAKQEAKLVTLLKQKSELQASGSKAAVTLKNQEIAATKSLIQAENASIKQAERNISIQLEGAKRIIAADKAVIQSKEQVAKAGDLRSDFIKSYVNTPSQNKFNASLSELNNLKEQGVISEGEYTKALKKSNDALKEGEPIRDNQFNHMIRMLRWAGTLAAAFYGIKTAWDATIGTGIDAASQFEQMDIGISALIATNSTNVTAMGKHITASEKFALAQKEAANAVLLLRQANIDTPATLEQVTKGFQAALGPAMQLGFGIKQTVEYTRLMTIAAMSMQVPMEQLAQETRSILDATIDQNSIVAKNLGLTNDQIKAHKTQGDLYEFLIKKLSDFNSAGNAVSKSWTGVTSDLTDAWRAFTADFVKSSGIFDNLKESLGDLSKLLKNQNGELDTYVGYLKDAAVAATAFYITILLGRGVQALKEIDLATKIATVSQINFNTAVKLNPWVATATLIATAVTGLYEYSSILDDIRTKQNKTAGSMGFLKDLGFIGGKPVDQQKSDIYKRGQELLKEQKALVSEYNKTWYEQSGIGFEGKSKIQLKNRIDAITEEQKALKKLQSSLSAPVTKAEDSLISKPKEKTAEELEKERKKQEAALAKQNREDIKAYELKKSLIEAEMAMQGRQTVQAEVRNKVDDATLREKFALEFKLQDIRKERFDAEVATAKAEIGDESARKNKIAILEKAYETDRKEFMTWELTQQDKINTQREKGYQDTAKAAYLLFDRETAVAQRALNNQDRGFDFTQAFGKNKVGIEEYQTAIADIQASADKALTSTVTAFVEKGVFSEEANAKLVENFDKLDNTVQSKVDHWKDKLAEIPDIELNIKMTGVDDVTTALASVVNSFGDMAKANKKYDTYSIESAKKIKSLKDQGLDTAEEELKLGKLKTQNNYDQIATYQAIAGAVSGVFQQGSKEAAAFMIVQQGLALTNAVTGIAMALGSSPWTGIATAAAAAAFIMPMLSQIGVVLGMGGSRSVSYDAFSAMAANEGKGSILGDNTKGSESITKSLEIMANLAKPEFRLMTAMSRSLESIDSKIGGVTSLLLRQGGFAMGEGYQGFDTGMKMTGIAGSATNLISKVQTTAVDVLTLGLDKKLLGGGISSILNGVMGSVMGGLFGKSSTSQAMTDSGITFANALLKDAKESFQGSAYQTILTVTSSKSWFSSSSSMFYNTYFEGLNDEVERQFSLVLSGLYDTTLLAGQALDTSAVDIDKSLANFVVSIGKISLKDKTGDQIQETLTNIFGKIGDDIAKTAFPALIPFQKVGEGLFETMSRVASGMEEADYYISRLGKSFSDIKYTSIVNTQGDVGVEALRQSILALEGTSSGVAQIIQGLTGNIANLYDTYASLDRLRFSLAAIGTSTEGLTSSMLYGAGGIQALDDATQSYIDAYLTESEKAAYQATVMTDAFKDLGLAMPKTKQGFSDLLKSIDVSTAGGQDLYGRLILLSTGFSDLTDSVTAAFKDITAEAQNLSDAFTSMAKSIQDTIDKLLSTASGSSQSAMIGAFWDKRAQADVLLSKRGDLTVKEQQTLQGLVNDIDSLAISIQGAQIGSTGSITSSLVGQLQDLKSSVNIDNAIIQSRILDANGQVTNVATEGTLTRLANAMADRNAMLGIDGSHADGLGYVPFDGYVAQLHKGERVLTAAEANGFGGRTIVSFDTSALEAINNKIYDKINLMYGILNDAQLGARPLYVKAQSYDTFRMS